MKMICPHCGVKGSADDAFLGRKVKCPKCVTIFVVEAEVVEAIDVGELDLEQLDDDVDEHIDTASEKEIDDVFSRLLASGAEEAGAGNSLAGAGSLLGEAGEGVGQDDIVAALSDPEDDTSSENELLGEEQHDETLTVIEDFPEDVILDSAEAEFYGETSEEEVAAALDGIDIDDKGQNEKDTLNEKKELYHSQMVYIQGNIAHLLCRSANCLLWYLHKHLHIFSLHNHFSPAV